MPVPYAEKLEATTARLDMRMSDVLSSLAEVQLARLHPLQDDWDDAMDLANGHLLEAQYYIERASRALKEGS